MLLSYAKLILENIPEVAPLMKTNTTPSPFKNKLKYIKQKIRMKQRINSPRNIKEK